MRKRKKTSVVVDQPRRSKPIAVVLSAAAFAGCCAIVFNTFFNQGAAGSAALVAQNNGTTRVTIDAGQKTSRTITLKYDALVEDVQRELLATGHFEGLVDGVTGPRTKVAIESYQRENKLVVTGETSKTLLEHIQYTRKLNQAAEFTGSVSVEQPLAQPAILPVAKLSSKTPAKPQIASTGDNAISKLQVRLAMLGYDPGSRSGQLDDGTRSAILIFEMDHGLPMQGKISKALLAEIKAIESKKKP